jgi:hypothetical protein
MNVAVDPERVDDDLVQRISGSPRMRGQTTEWRSRQSVVAKRKISSFAQ